MKLTSSLAALALLAALCTTGAGVASAEDPYVVELDVVLSKKKGRKPKGGVVKVEVHPDWAPIGAARFKEIVKEGIWEWNRFFRCVRVRARARGFADRRSRVRALRQTRRVRSFPPFFFWRLLQRHDCSVVPP